LFRLSYFKNYGRALFEKIEIKWFSVTEMKKKIKEFRPFYQDIVRHILEELPKIKEFCLQQQKKRKNKTLCKRKKQKRYTKKNV
jgi:hypothetical protein